MHTQLKNDISRCYGYKCNLKKQCKRYLTMDIDKPDLYAYSQTLRNPKKSELTDCDSYMEDI
jgi:hypothetical protein